MRKRVAVIVLWAVQQIACGDVSGVAGGGSGGGGGDHAGGGGDAGSQAFFELGTCGDMVVDPWEVCDDGNQVGGDGCSADCRSDDQDAPVVLLTLPVHGDAEVDVDTTVTVVFGEAIDPGTLTSSSFSLAVEGGGAVPASVVAMATGGILTPQAPLARGTTYTATVTTAVTDAAGNALASAVSWSFTTRPPPRWRLAQRLNEPSAGRPAAFSLGADAAGNATVLFDQAPNGSTSEIASSRRVDDGWTVAERITGIPGVKPWIAVHPAGRAVAIWKDSVTSAGSSSVFGARYVPGEGWKYNELQYTTAGGEGDLRIAVDAVGNAMAVWTEGSPPNQWRSRYDVDAGWASPQLLASRSDAVAGQPHVAMDDAGNAIVAWAQGSPRELWARRYVAGEGWETPEVIGGFPSGESAIALAMNGAGEAVALWPQYSGGASYQIWASRYSPATAWGTPAPIEAEGEGKSSSPSVAMNQRGDAMAVWQVTVGSSVSIWANRLDALQGWGEAESLADGPQTAYPHVAMNTAGESMVIWHQYLSLSRQTGWARPHHPVTGWSEAEQFDSTLGRVTLARVAMSDGGYPTVAFIHTDSVYSRTTLMVSEYR